VKATTILENIRLAEAFIRRARKAVKKIEEHSEDYRSKETASLRRVSMEMTRALSSMRAGK